ncbi:hypothetical protein [Methylobacterium longum]|jgi:hypothetical protein|uniref:Uncharacterized protein n=1 Tax=Methylobacterium longum TaxID=767694 RepID=A0ABT8AI03_9HYPH|nr:hypothetical protein [Methylobacterium longum]MDN3569290.1 hypothetical protein [Methylobacterium longum]GJE14899.1 hypothetical protein FOHLNKBM_5976 [Methylobacterium longum]
MTAASILALVESIERHGSDAPAAIAFRTALTRKGREAHLAGGSATLDAIQREIVTADPRRAVARTTILAAAWSGITERGR